MNNKYIDHPYLDDKYSGPSDEELEIIEEELDDYIE